MSEDDLATQAPEALADDPDRIVPNKGRLLAIATQHGMLPTTPSADPLLQMQRWEHFVRTYQPALVAYVQALLCEQGAAGSLCAEDIVQDYFTECFAKGWLQRQAQPIRCFRALVADQLKKLVVSSRRRATSQKRRPQGGIRPLDGMDVAARRIDRPEAELDRRLVGQAFEAALRALENESAERAAIIRDLMQAKARGERLDTLPLTDAERKKRGRARLALGRLVMAELGVAVPSDLTSLAELLDLLDPYLP